MSPILLSLLAFVPVLLGILVGGWVQGKLPEGHQSSDSKEVVKLSLGIMGTLAALVLGLLVASAQSSYAARETEIKQLTADVILLDHLLDLYGKDAESVRVSLRNVVPGRRAIDISSSSPLQGCLGGRSVLSPNPGPAACD